MNKQEFALTRTNLLYMGLFEPFHSLYDSYKTILSNKLEEVRKKNGNSSVLDIVRKETKHQTRELFNAFLKEYTYVFTDEFKQLYTDRYFLNRIDLLYLKKKKDQHFMFDYCFSSFSQFLIDFEWAVGYALCKRKEKDFSYTLNEELCLRMLNMRIENQVLKGKIIQLSEKDPKYNLCEKLIIFDNLKNISCNQNGHEIISSFCYCKIGCEKVVRLPIHSCLECGKSFIGSVSLKLYEQIYGKLLVDKFLDNTNESIDFENFGKSALYKTGYNAKENGMTDAERQRILRELIDTEVLSYFEIIRDLENAIQWHKGKPSDRFAVERWSRDLVYINCLLDSKAEI